MAEPEAAQGFCKQEAPGPACFGSEKNRGRLLGGDWGQGKKWASLATGTGNRGGGAQEAGLSSYTCRHWTKPWGCSSDGNTDPCSLALNVLVSRKENSRKIQVERGWPESGFDC